MLSLCCVKNLIWKYTFASAGTDTSTGTCVPPIRPKMLLDSSSLPSFVFRKNTKKTHTKTFQTVLFVEQKKILKFCAIVSYPSNIKQKKTSENKLVELPFQATASMLAYKFEGQLLKFSAAFVCTECEKNGGCRRVIGYRAFNVNP